MQVSNIAGVLRKTGYMPKEEAYELACVCAVGEVF
jgi:hypothetical protein